MPALAGSAGSDDMQKLKTMSSLTYKEQAMCFLNAFWKSGPTFGENVAEAENIWQWQAKCVDLDRKGEEGCELDEFKAHQLLESIEDTLTVKEMREVLREVDLDFNKMVSYTEFLIYKYSVDWHVLVNAPQGDLDEAKLAEAQARIDAASKAIEECNAKASKAKKDEIAARSAEAAATETEKQAKKAEKDAIGAELAAKEAEKKAEDAEKVAKESEAAAFSRETEARKAEDEAVKAENYQKDIEAQVASALAELQREEDAFNEKCAKLEATSKDQSVGQVKRGTAANELAQLKATDPMPLQRAKINQEAVVRRQQKATKSAVAKRMAASQARKVAETAREEAVAAREEAEATRVRAANRRAQAVATREGAEKARAQAEAARAQAEAARAEAVAAREAADAAVEASVQAYQSAVAYLEKVKEEMKGAGRGKLWWMDRELEEKKKYMSQAQLARLAAAGK